MWLLAAALAATATAAAAADELRLSVDGAVRLALERSRDVEDAGLELTQADERVAEAWGEVWPHVDLAASYARNISPAVSFVPANLFDPTAAPGTFIALQFGADNSWQTAVTLEQPLFDPGLLVGLGAAERYRRLQVEVVRGRQQEVATRVRLACYDLLLRAEEVRLTQRSLERVHEALAETRARAGAGLASDYDVLRLEVEVANLEPALLRSGNALASARRQLAVELAVDDPARIQLTDSLAAAPEAGARPAAAGLVDLALARRSDVLQLEATTQLRRSQVRREQVQYLPTVSLFGAWEMQAQQNGGPDFFGTADSRATSKVAGVRVRLPLFTGLQRDARIDLQQAALRQSQTRARLARDRAAAQVQDLDEARAEARARARAQGLAVAQAGRGFQIALARLRQGLGSQLEVTDAEMALRQSEFNHAQAAHDLLATQARLDLAVGRVAPVDDGAMEVTP